MERNEIINAVSDCSGQLDAYDLYVRYFEERGEKYDDFCELLGELTGDGTLAVTKKGKVVPGSQANVIRGVFHASSRGFGFVTPQSEADKGVSKSPKDLYIAESDTHGAINGDIVLAALTKLGKPSDGRSRNEGRITRIVSRSVKTVVGTLRRLELRGRFGSSKQYVEPDDPKINFNIYIEAASELSADDGCKVEVELTQYPEPGSANAYGRITQVFGSDPLEANYSAILHEYGISETFPKEVVDEAEEVSKAPVDPKGRLDLRGDVILTIDSEDAKDLDDAISIKKLPGGGYLLGVHIADVSEYVREGGELDREAMERGTSVYFVDKVVPMLPTALSNGCCSLNGGVDRYALSALVELDAEGKIVDTQLHESVIKTAVRGVYSELNDVAARGRDSQWYDKYSMLFPDTLPTMIELYEILERNGKTRGALELETVEAKILLDADGNVSDVVKRERGVTERLIEQFMLTANEAVANWLFWQNMLCVYRIHEDPPADKIQTFAVFAHNLGLNITSLRSKTIRSNSLQTILEQAKERGLDTIVSYVLLRSLAKARYSPTCSPHFGLAIEKYCHFTSPIRRYPDLSVHRIVKAVLRGEVEGEKYAHLEAFASKSAEMSTENELRAVKAEREIEALYLAIYMSGHIGETFDGVISSVMSFGFFVELDNTCEGMVPVSSLPGYFDYSEQTMSLHCGRQTYTLGQPVKVKIESVDITNAKIEMRVAD